VDLQDYEDLFNAPEGHDQPTAIPLSMITGEPMDIEAGPNWDDDLGGSPVYAANDPNLKAAARTAPAAVRHRAAGVLLLSRASATTA
jgi:nitrate reductase beta subunit